MQVNNDHQIKLNWDIFEASIQEKPFGYKMIVLYNEFCLGDSNITVCIILSSISLIKIMLKPSSPRGRQFTKSGCQLSQFPIIKLHIFTDIFLLDLSNNLISDLAPLHTHSATTPYVLSKLRVVNFAQNQFASVQALLPLAKAGRRIELIDISSNPLVQNLNFLYEIALGFEGVTKIVCGYQVEVDDGVRKDMVKQQMEGGSIINIFLQSIEKRSKSMRHNNMQEEKEMLENLLLELQHPPNRITQQNQRIFHTMQQFITYSFPPQSSPTYRSPYHPKYSSQQIQVRSEYQVASPNILMRYLTEEDERTGQLVEFYYRELVMRQAINGKLLQEIEVEESVLLEIEEGRKALSLEEFMAEVRKKWRSNLKMTSELIPAYSQQGSRISHFKSIQTDITSHPLLSSGEHQLIYFGFDREWTSQTLQFLRHRLVSLIRDLLKPKVTERQPPQTFIKGTLSPSIYQSPPSHSYNAQPSNFSLLSPSSSLQQFVPSTFSSRSPPNPNYQTFGQSHPSQKALLSPKSRNKFIIGSLVNVLQLTVKRIVLNRIIKGRTIKNQQIMYLHYAFNKISKKYQQDSFRKIFQISIFYECLQEKMEAFKKKIVFKAWKQLKKRKMKLLKGILVRKLKKEKALLSVFLTQMRLNSRSITLEHKMLKSKAELLSSSGNDLHDVSCILKRSVTCQKSLQFQYPHTYSHLHPFPIKMKESDRTIQARRNFLKRPSQK